MKEELKQQELDGIKTKTTLSDALGFLSTCDIKGADALKMHEARQLITSLIDQVDAALADLHTKLEAVE